MPLDRFIALTRAGIERLRRSGTDVMLMEPQLSPKTAEAPGALSYRDALRRLGASLGVPVIRRYDLMRTWLAKGLLSPWQILAPDGLHMTDDGYALLAKAVARAILKAATSPRDRNGG